MNALRLLGVMTGVCFVIVYFIRSTIKSALQAKSDLSTIGKIGFSFLQFNSIALQFDYEFPPFIDDFLTVQEQPATVANGVMSIDCFVKDSPSVTMPSLYVKAIGYLAAPIIVAVLCRVVFCKYYTMKATEHEVDSTTPRRMSSLALLTRMELPEDSKARAYVNAWNHYITAVIITIFMIHPNIVQITFALFSHMKLGANDDDYYLVEDLSVKATTATHISFMLFVATPLLVFYVFGLPLFVLWRLYMNRDELTKPFEEVDDGMWCHAQCS